MKFLKCLNLDNKIKLIQVMKKNKNFSNITKHGKVSGIYFNNILKNIISLIDIKKKVIILDFGSGYGYLKKKLIKNSRIKIINYDKIRELSDIDDWRKVKFDYLISTHVFMYFKKKDLKNLLSSLKKHNKKLKIIVTISRQSFLNNIGKFILNEKNAHKGTFLQPKKEIELLKTKMKVIKKINIFFLSDIYLLEFK